jgi:hypothetical protein
VGFKISWLAAQGLSKGELLAHFGLHDTQIYDEVNEEPFSSAEIPTGWAILFSNDCAWATGSRAIALSKKVRVLTCALHEGVMVSESAFFENGQLLWQVMHDGQLDAVNLETHGALPANYNVIKDAAFPLEMDDEVDYAFDVPIDLALTICGWRHDLCEFDWGTPYFTKVE